MIPLIASLALAQDARGWIQYVNRTDLFSVMLPRAPEARQTTHVSAYDVIYPARVYSVEDGASVYSLTVVDYTEAERRHATRPDPTDATSGEGFWVGDVRASVVHAAEAFRQRGGDVTYAGYAVVDKIEGQQLQIVNPDQSRSFVAIHLHASRLYILEARVPKNAPPPALFPQSLRIIDEQGRRIRYTLDPDGQRVKVDLTRLGNDLDTVEQLVVE
ncbi:MAG TPA: hypothetical protein VGC50_00690 [Gammaproteobacteria bacterium]|jgi:hypothetical protein